MGQFWSTIQSSPNCNNVDCAEPSTRLQGDAAIAGVGTFAAFFLTAVTTLGLSIWVIIVQWTEHDPEAANYRGNRNSDKIRRRWEAQNKRRHNVVLESVVTNFSDQQLVTGLALAASTRYIPNCELSAYHYNIICYLLLCSVVTHLCSLLVVDKYFYPFRPSRAASWSNIALLAGRSLGIIVTIAITGLVLFARDENKFPVQHPPSYIDSKKDLLKPAVCFFRGVDTLDSIFKNIPADVNFTGKGKNWAHGLIQYVLFVFCVIITVPIAVLHSLDRGIFWKKPGSKIILLFRSVVVTAALGLTVTMFVEAWALRQWMHKSSWLAPPGTITVEDQWSFTALLSLLVMCLAPFNMFQAAAEKYDQRKLVETNGYLNLREFTVATGKGSPLVTFDHV